ncbi:syj1, partial [Symbiodinium natans]
MTMHDDDQLVQNMSTRKRGGALVLLCFAANCMGWLGSTPQPTRMRVCLRAEDDTLERLSRVSRVPSKPPSQEPQEGSLMGAVGGSVLGGLLLGPFGAVFGASLGSDLGRLNRDQASVEALGLDADMVNLARTVAKSLADAVEDKKRVISVKDDLAIRIVKLEGDVEKLSDEAMAALQAGDEDGARSILEKKVPLQQRLTTSKDELKKALERVSVVSAAVQRLEGEALKVASLLERAQAATGSERAALADEASAMTVKDPLLDKFDRLERVDLLTGYSAWPNWTEALGLSEGQTEFLRSVRRWTGKCQVQQARLSRHPGDLASNLRFSIRVCSWNLHGCAIDPEDDIRPWLFSAGQADIYIVGIQELVELGPMSVFLNTDGHEERQSELELKIEAALAATGLRYLKICSFGMVGLSLLAYASESLQERVGEIDCDRVKTGIEGLSGNKGGLCVRFLLGPMSLCFANVHLPSGTGKADERNEHLNEVLSYAFQGTSRNGST